MSTQASGASSRTQPRQPIAGTPSQTADGQIEPYGSMSRSLRTSEPSDDGVSRRQASKRKPSASRGLPFVIHMQGSEPLRYDFRLSWGGVLKSWAIAKGPSYNPQERRLAVQAEDYPIEHAAFEGVIQEGEARSGTVMIWDQGSWWPQLGSENVDACLRSGHLKFELGGSKLRGRWALIRMNPNAADPAATPRWLLLKERDKYERGPRDRAITDERPNSAVTGRSLQQIAAAMKDTRPHGGSRPEAASDPSGAAADPRADAPARSKPQPIRIEDLPREPQPNFIPPQLAMETTATPNGSGWIHEIKLDGYRIQARKSGSQVSLLTRKGVDWAHRMPALVNSLAQLPAQDCTLDGEVVVQEREGRSSFARLQAALQRHEADAIHYIAFDLLHLDGHSTRDISLHERKELLANLLPANGVCLRLSEEIPGEGAEAFRQACAFHAEGIVSKRSSAPYRGARSSDWLKSKCMLEQEMVIAGFTLSSEGPDRIGALLLGYFPPIQRGPRKKRFLIYAGRTGTGFSQGLRRELLNQLVQIRVPQCSFETVPKDATRDVYWVDPVMVAQIRFTSWTSEHLIRQATFLGLREDIPASAVTHNAANSDSKPEKPVRPSKNLAPRSFAGHSRSQDIQRFTLPARRRTKGAATIDPTPTQPERHLYPECALDREQLGRYYALVAERMLPFLAKRPLSVVCFPEGAGKPCWWKKLSNPPTPPGIKTIVVQLKGSAKPEPCIELDTAEAIISLAQMDVLEIYPWSATSDNLEQPDRLIFDLDPDPNLPWVTLAAAAAEVRQRLINAGLESFLKLSGGKGLHIIAPIQPNLSWAEVKTAAHAFALSLERHNPFLYVTRMTKTSRAGKIYLDYLRNQRGSATVAPYSPRIRQGAPVSLPIPWSALNRETHPSVSVQDFLSSQTYLRSNPWKEFLTTDQQLHPTQIAIW
ncbi:MAG: DNA ligase D [Acidobacteriota bacterium]